MPRHSTPIRVKIERRIAIDESTGCWNWTGALNQYGYAMLTYTKPDGQRTSTTAHRVAYMEYVGPVADGIQVCHRCDNPRCVNPSHLFLGTAQQNIDDMMAKGRGNRGHGARPASAPEHVMIAAANDNRPGKVVRTEYGISHSTLQRWRAAYRGDRRDDSPGIGRKSKFTREQIIAFANDNRPQAVVAADAGVAVVTVAKWRAKYRVRAA